MDCGEKIAKLRKEKHMTQAELGTKLNVTYQAVSKWERGESYPDFETMVRIAEIFRVNVEYFSYNGEVAVAQKQQTKSKAMVGVCSMCGKVLRKGEVAEEDPALLCADCVVRRDRMQAQEEYEKQARLRQAEAERQRKLREEENARNMKRAEAREELRKRRTWGFVVGGLLAAAILIIGIICTVSSDVASQGAVIGGTIALTLLSFTLVTQIFWGGAVRNVASTGGKVIGTPGIIFSFDLDGFIFLIAMKILFAVLRFIVWFVTMAFFVLVATVISPFTFIPCLVRVVRDIRDGYDSLEGDY